MFLAHWHTVVYKYFSHKCYHTTSWKLINVYSLAQGILEILGGISWNVFWNFSFEQRLCIFWLYHGSWIFVEVFRHNLIVSTLLVRCYLAKKVSPTTEKIMLCTWICLLLFFQNGKLSHSQINILKSLVVGSSFNVACVLGVISCLSIEGKIL